MKALALILFLSSSTHVLAEGFDAYQQAPKACPEVEQNAYQQLPEDEPSKPQFGQDQALFSEFGSLFNIPEDMEQISVEQRGSLYSSGWSGAGGDSQHQMSDNIWFLGEKPVTYCVKRSKDYPFTKAQVEKMVSSSIRDWTNFFKKYELDQNTVNRERRARSLNFPDGIERKASLQFIQKSCDEMKEENPGEGIVFLFGKTNALVKMYEEFSFESALGMAIRGKYDHSTYRSKGFVVLKNFTTDANKLYHMVLHEVGHVFGMKHDSVYVMDEDVALNLENERINDPFIGRIESPAWKYKLAEGETLILTHQKERVRGGAGAGPRGARRARMAARCPDTTFVPNRKIPQKILNRLGFNQHGCHQVRAEVTKVYGPKRYALAVTIEDERGIQRTISGDFKSERTRPLHSSAPGVYSKFIVENARRGKTREVWARGILDSIFQFPARGKLQGNRLRGVGARLTQDKGIKLELFFPFAKNWWVVE